MPGRLATPLRRIERRVGMPGAIDARTEEAVRQFLGRLGARQNVVGAILFGSRARGTHRPGSDADLAVLLPGDHQAALPVTLAMADLAYEVLLDTGINITPCRSGPTNGMTPSDSVTLLC